VCWRNVQTAASRSVSDLGPGGGFHLDASGGLAAIDHPSRSTAWLSKANVLFLPVLAFWLVFAGRLVLSWRRANGDRRQQLKWLMSGSAVAVAGFLISNLVPALDPGATAVGVGVVLPVCLGVAILKYRLYDIDRIISRTLAYAIVTGLLVGVYTGLVLLTTQVFKVHTRLRWPPPRWRRRRCSTRCDAGCSGWWTGGSTGPATTPTRPRPRSRRG
jgi:hypothetical protein